MGSPALFQKRAKIRPPISISFAAAEITRVVSTALKEVCLGRAFIDTLFILLESLGCRLS